MSLEMFFQMIEAVAVVFAVCFAVIQVRQHERRQARESAMELLHSFQTPDFAKALTLVYEMPEGLSKSEIEGRLGDDLHRVYALTTTWDSLGMLVLRGRISLAVVDDFFSGPVAISWRKMRSYFRAERREQQRETIGEWFEWLADRLADRETRQAPIPAHIAHTDWRPTRACDDSLFPVAWDKSEADVTVAAAHVARVDLYRGQLNALEGVLKTTGGDVTVGGLIIGSLFGELGKGRRRALASTSPPVCGVEYPAASSRARTGVRRSRWSLCGACLAL